MLLFANQLSHMSHIILLCTLLTHISCYLESLTVDTIYTNMRHPLYTHTHQSYKSCSSVREERKTRDETRHSTFRLEGSVAHSGISVALVSWIFMHAHHLSKPTENGA